MLLIMLCCKVLLTSALLISSPTQPASAAWIFSPAGLWRSLWYEQILDKSEVLLEKVPSCGEFDRMAFPQVVGTHVLSEAVIYSNC